MRWSWLVGAFSVVAMAPDGAAMEIPSLRMRPLLPERAPHEVGHSGAGTHEPWEFRLSPYFWAASLEADVQVGSASADGTIDFSDVWDALEFGGMLHLEAQNGKWILIGDLAYIDLGDEVGQADLDEEMFLGEFAVGYELLSSGDRRPCRLDVLAGNRYVDSEASIRLPSGVKRSTEVDWLDPIIGARVRFALTEGVGLQFRGDIGGFDMGGSKLAWNLIGAAAFRLTDGLELSAGYRILDFEFEESRAAGRTEIDLSFYGPFVGLTFTF